MALAKLPSRNIILIIILGAGIIFFVLFSIFPKYIAYSDITQEIEMLKDQIEEQKILSPIFDALSKKAEFKEPKGLPFPPKKKLTRAETGEVSAVIQDIIQSNGMTLESISTDIDSLTNDPGIFKLYVELAGDFMNLRNVILQLGALPYLEHIESIKINSRSESTKMNLKLWFAQQ